MVCSAAFAVVVVWAFGAFRRCASLVVARRSVSAVKLSASSESSSPTSQLLEGSGARRALLKERREVEQRLKELDRQLRFATVVAFEEADGTLCEDEWLHEAYLATTDFGYLSKSAGVYTELLTKTGSGPPPSAPVVAGRNFARELQEAFQFFFNKEATAWSAADSDARKKISQFTLSNHAVWVREEAREQIDAPLVLKVPYYLLCFALDFLFDNRPIARFWFLETVARMPYFSYISMLHLYETLGWWRRSAEAKKVHFAEEWNEFHHLLAMETLGGDERWPDRFFAHHAAVVYYWVLVVLWLLSPNLAYQFSELIEAHAVDTYAQFVEENRKGLASLAAPKVIRDYYESDSLFTEFQTGQKRPRPTCETLLDVFENIRDDEESHVETMAACSDPCVAKRAQATEFVTIVAIAAISIPLAFFFLSDEACLLTYCPDNLADQLTGNVFVT